MSNKQIQSNFMKATGYCSLHNVYCEKWKAGAGCKHGWETMECPILPHIPDCGYSDKSNRVEGGCKCGGERLLHPQCRRIMFCKKCGFTETIIKDEEKAG